MVGMACCAESPVRSESSAMERWSADAARDGSLRILGIVGLGFYLSEL